MRVRVRIVQEGAASEKRQEEVYGGVRCGILDVCTNLYAWPDSVLVKVEREKLPSERKAGLVFVKTTL